MNPSYTQSGEDEIARYGAFLNSLPDGSRLSEVLRGSMVYVERSIRENIDQSANILQGFESLQKQITAANIRTNEEAERKIAAQKELRQYEEAYEKSEAENVHLIEERDRAVRDVARLTARLRIYELEAAAARIADELTRARETLAADHSEEEVF